VFDTDAGAGQVMVIGDGLVSIDGQLTEYEQDNRPDYLGYHLGEDFERGTPVKRRWWTHPISRT
jgi:hypothetical protein